MRSRTLAAPRAEYQSVLYERALELGVDVRLGCTIQEIDQSAPCVKLEGGVEVAADLIIGADGKIIYFILNFSVQL
jgi:salicylate hydroxylase